MLPGDIIKIEKKDIEALIANGVREGKSIEFKREIRIGTDGDKKEFLADVSSFANAYGGDLIFGLEEEKGKASRLAGITTTDADALTLQIESIIRAGITKRIAYRLCSFEIEKDKFIFLIRIPESTFKPHRVTFGGHDKYYSRGENGKYQMDHDEVGRAFVQTDNVIQKIDSFVQARLLDIEKNILPIPLAPYGKVVIHLIPRLSLLFPQTYDLADPAVDIRMICPLGGGSRTPEFNEDGLVSSSGIMKDYRHCYVQVYRNGIIETVNGEFLYPYEQQPRIPVSKDINYELFVVNCIQDYLNYYSKMSIDFPVHLVFSLVGCKDYYVAGDAFRYPFGEVRRISKNIITSGVLNLNNSGDDIPTLLRPVFYTIWNGCGFSRSFNYSDQGIWNPIR